MKGYYKIDTQVSPIGKFELWESERYGDEAPAVVTLDGEPFGETWDSLWQFLKDETVLYTGLI